MDSLPSFLKEDYLRNIKLLKEDDFQPNGYKVCVNDVLKSHYILCDYFSEIDGGKIFFGVKNINLIGSAVSRQDTSWEGKRKWVDSLDVCASLFFGLTKNHGFEDGNKRTALLILLLQLTKLDRIVDCNQGELLELAVRTAASELELYRFSEKYKNCDDREVRIISEYLRKKTHKADFKMKTMTYFELDHKLRQYGCRLDNLDRNFVDVIIPKKTFLGSKVDRIQISCRSMKSQVSANTIKDILKKIGVNLTTGLDYKMFLEGAEPMYKLIQDYENPLRRLKDK